VSVDALFGSARRLRGTVAARRGRWLCALGSARTRATSTCSSRARDRAAPSPYASSRYDPGSAVAWSCTAANGVPCRSARFDEARASAGSAIATNATTAFAFQLCGTRDPTPGGLEGSGIRRAARREVVFEGDDLVGGAARIDVAGPLRHRSPSGCRRAQAPREPRPRCTTSTGAARKDTRVRRCSVDTAAHGAVGLGQSSSHRPIVGEPLRRPASCRVRGGRAVEPARPLPTASQRRGQRARPFFPA